MRFLLGLFGIALFGVAVYYVTEALVRLRTRHLTRKLLRQSTNSQTVMDLYRAAQRHKEKRRKAEASRRS